MCKHPGNQRIRDVGDLKLVKGKHTNLRESWAFADLLRSTAMDKLIAETKLIAVSAMRAATACITRHEQHDVRAAHLSLGGFVLAILPQLEQFTVHLGMFSSRNRQGAGTMPTSICRPRT